MTISYTPNLVMTELQPAQSQPHVPINADLRILDSLVQISVLSIVAAPPGSPVDGDRHIVSTSSPSGAYAGHGGEIAYYVAGTFNQWRFLIPKDGWMAFNRATRKFYFFDDDGSPPTGWIIITAGTGIGP